VCDDEFPIILAATAQAIRHRSRESSSGLRISEDLVGASPARNKLIIIEPLGRPLTGEPGTAEFTASYGAIRDRHTGATFNALVRGYTLSVELFDLQRRTDLSTPPTRTEQWWML
jgi:hypothetical protein